MGLDGMFATCGTFFDSNVPKANQSFFFHFCFTFNFHASMLGISNRQKWPFIPSLEGAALVHGLSSHPIMCKVPTSGKSEDVGA